MNPIAAIRPFLQQGAQAIDNGLSNFGQALGGAVVHGAQDFMYHPTTDPATLNPNTPHTPVTQQLPPWIQSPIPTGNVVPHTPDPSFLQHAQQMIVNIFQPHPAQAVLGAQQAPVPTRIPIRATPTPTPTIPPWGADQPVLLKQPIPAATSEPAIAALMQQIAPNSPMATPGATMWMAQAAQQYNLHPYLLPTIAKAETNALQPGRPDQTQLAAAIAGNNPWNTLVNGKTEFNYTPYGGLPYAINKYAGDIAQDWTGQGWTKFRQNPTLQNFIQYAQNPSDNPQGEINNMVQMVGKALQQRFGGGE